MHQLTWQHYLSVPNAVVDPGVSFMGFHPLTACMQLFASFLRVQHCGDFRYNQIANLKPRSCITLILTERRNLFSANVQVTFPPSFVIDEESLNQYSAHD